MSETELKKEKTVLYFLTLLLFLGLLFSFLTYKLGIINLDSANFYSTVFLSLAFAIVPISYLSAKGNNLKSIVKLLGLSKDKFKGKYLLYGVAIFLVMIAIEYAIDYTYVIFHIPYKSIMGEISDMPTVFFIMLFTIFPIDEEILFRGFLVPRVGIIASAVLFSLIHLGYMSVGELVFALLFGLISGYIYKRTNSLYTTILGHALINLLSVIIFVI